jgi:hypothetical protein
MGQMLEMDDKMDDMGYLRFCTHEQTMRLMGNAISEEVAALAQESGLSAQAADLGSDSKGLMKRLVQFKWVRYILQDIVNMIYKWLH